MRTKILGVATIALSFTACDVINAPRKLTQQERLTTELGARRYVAGTNGAFLSCYTLDRNHDGHVTCSIREGGSETTTDILCGYQSGQPGCKQKGKP